MAIFLLVEEKNSFGFSSHRLEHIDKNIYIRSEEKFF